MKLEVGIFRRNSTESLQKVWQSENESIFLQIKQVHNIKNKKIMAIEIKTIPVLHGEAAARFVEAADEALEKRGTIDFSNQVAKARAILKRSKLYI